MKFAITLLAFFALTSSAGAGVITTTAVPTVGMPGSTTITIWYGTDGNEVFQGVDITVTGPLNQVNPFGLDTTFQDGNIAFSGWGADISQDSQLLFASGDILSIGAEESANLLKGAISGIHLRPGGVTNPTPFAQVSVLISRQFDVRVDIEIDNATGIDFGYSGPLVQCHYWDPTCPEPSTALLALLGMTGVVMRRP